MLSGPSFCVSGPSLISVTYEHLIADTSSRNHQVCFNAMRLADDKQRGGCASFFVSSPYLISITHEQLVPDTPSRTHQVCFSVMILADDKQRGGCAVQSFFLCLQCFFN